MSLERVSIEVTNRCAKACDFCYQKIQPLQGTPSRTWSDAQHWMDEEGNEREGGALT